MQNYKQQNHQALLKARLSTGSRSIMHTEKHQKTHVTLTFDLEIQ